MHFCRFLAPIVGVSLVAVSYSHAEERAQEGPPSREFQFKFIFLKCEVHHFEHKNLISFTLYPARPLRLSVGYPENVIRGIYLRDCLWLQLPTAIHARD